MLDAAKHFCCFNLIYRGLSLKKDIVGLAISQGNLGDSIRTKVKTDQNFSLQLF